MADQQRWQKLVMVINQERWLELVIKAGQERRHKLEMVTV